MAKQPFRETLWFKKGMLDIEQAQAADAAGEDDLHPRAADLLPIEDRYDDDGSVSREDSKMFSIRTGHTEHVPVIDTDVKSVESVESLVGDLKRGRGKVIALIGASMMTIAAIVFLAV
jgi:hypothetical protein